MIVACGRCLARVSRGTAVLLALALCACASQKPKPFEENVVPVDFRGQVAEQVRRQLNPRNVRDAYIAEPVLKASPPTTRYISCVRFTADVGAGPGSREYAAYFYNGKITQLVTATREQCGDANYLPFPELLPH